MGCNEHGLTDKEEAFCHQYVLEAQDGVKAYLSAGYRAKNHNVAAVSAYRLLEKVEILDRIQALRQVKDSAFVLSVQQRKQLLSWMATNVNHYVRARIAAIDILNKMEGIYIQPAVDDERTEKAMQLAKDIREIFNRDSFVD